MPQPSASDSRPVHAAEPAADKCAAEFAEAGDRDQSEGQESRSGSARTVRLVAQAGQPEEHRHEQRER